MSVQSITAIAASCTVVLAFLGTVAARTFRALSRLERALEVVDGRSKQLETNGGSTIFDGLRRVETKVDRLAEDVVVVRERTAVVETVAAKAAHDVANVRQSVDGLAVLLPRRSGDLI